MPRCRSTCRIVARQCRNLDRDAASQKGMPQNQKRRRNLGSDAAMPFHLP
jgi:hypothetical protein